MIAAIVAGRPIPRAVPNVILSDVDNPFELIDEPVGLGELVVGEVLLPVAVWIPMNIVVGPAVPDVEASQAKSLPGWK